jgi:hypothetical protein
VVDRAEKVPVEKLSQAITANFLNSDQVWREELQVHRNTADRAFGRRSDIPAGKALLIHAMTAL